MINTFLRPTVYVILLTIGFVTSLQASIPNPALLLPTLPQQYLETRYQSIQQSFEQRVTFFLKGRPFKSWRLYKPDPDILNEFSEINEWRYHSWYVDPNASTLISRTDFMVAQDLLEKGLYQKPGFLAFQYNQTDGSYNSSTVVLNGFRFLALESPTQHTLRNFYLLLQNHRVTQLVRLSIENDTKSISYWVNNLKTNPKTKDAYLSIPAKFNLSPYTLRYYSADYWINDNSVQPKELLSLIQKVRMKYHPGDLIACHSNDGAGRAGTFIAGFLLLNEIDRQLASGVSKESLNISIEKIVMQLSLQRPHLVQNSAQYRTLYRLVDLYIENMF